MALSKGFPLLVYLKRELNIYLMIFNLLFCSNSSIFALLKISIARLNYSVIITISNILKSKSSLTSNIIM